MLVTKICCDVKYKKCHQWIIENLEAQQCDLYLLMEVDFPWVHDPLREHLDKRKYLFGLYQKELETRKLKYKIVSGRDDERFNNAKGFVNEVCKSE